MTANYERALGRYQEAVERLREWLESKGAEGWGHEEWVEYLRLSLSVILSGMECRDALVSLERFEASRESRAK